MEWTGGCLCGDIRFQITEDPDGARHCHCSLCRKQTGTAFTTGVRFAAESFEWTKGKPVYFRDSVAANRSFCARCGSSMTWEAFRGYITVFIGSLDRAEDIYPIAHYYTSTMLPWLKFDDGLPQYLEGGPDTPTNKE